MAISNLIMFRSDGKRPKKEIFQISAPFSISVTSICFQFSLEWHEVRMNWQLSSASIRLATICKIPFPHPREGEYFSVARGND